jgi:hypothetical protein
LAEQEAARKAEAETRQEAEVEARRQAEAQVAALAERKSAEAAEAALRLGLPDRQRIQDRPALRRFYTSDTGSLLQFAMLVPGGSEAAVQAVP